MNFNRIKWIFIVAFFILDIGLLSSQFLGTQFHTSQSQNQSQVTLKEMKNDMISHQPLSTKRQSGYYVAAQEDNQLAKRVDNLHGQSAKSNDGTVVSSFNNNIKINESKPLKDQLDKIVYNSKRIIDGNQYVYDQDQSSKGQIVYAQQMNGKKVLDHEGQLRIRLNNNNEITGYSQSHLINRQILRSREVTDSQRQAVIWLYKHNQIPNNTQIKKVTFGYSKLTDRDNQIIYVPTWLVRMKTKGNDNVQTLRVNAFTGTALKTKTNS